MAYLSNIIETIEKKYDLKALGTYHHKTLINSVRFLTKNDSLIPHLMPNTIYLADNTMDNLSFESGTILFIGCDEKETKNESIFIKENMSIFEIYNTISDVLLDDHWIEQKKQSLFNILYICNNIEDLLRSAYSVISNPIFVLDTSFTILSYYPEIIDPDVFEQNNNRMTLKISKSDNMKKKSITQKIMHSVYPFITSFDDIGSSCVFDSIRVKHSVVGYIFIRCINTIPEKDELDYIHVLTQMISVQLQKDDSYQNPYEIKYDIFYHDLFSERYKEEETAIFDLKKLGMEPKQEYVLIASNFIERNKKMLATNYYCLQLATIFENSINSKYNDFFITLVSRSDIKKIFRDLKKFETYLNMNHMKASISHSFSNILDAPTYLEQCISTLRYHLVHYDETPISFFGDYFFDYLIGHSINKNEVLASIHPIIKKMKHYDDKNHTEYLKTLKTYIKTNRNAPATAKALFIHKSTLFYRFDKMKDLFDVVLDQSDHLFAYECSIRMLEILKQDKKSHF